MSAPSHMSLRDRKAFALEATYLKAVRRVAPAAGADEIAAVFDAIRALSVNISNDETRPGAQGPLDAFLVDAAQRVETIVTVVSGAAGPSEAAQKVVTECKRLAAAIKCEKCAYGKICNGEDEDDAIVAAERGGHCIADIKSAIEIATHLAKAEYRSHMGEDVVLPDLVFHSVAVGDRPGEIPGVELAVNGTTEFTDGRDSKVSSVELRVASTKLNRFSIVGLPYLALHEVLCHGFQMMRTTHQRPNKAGIPDPISEGMMDAIAVELLGRRVSGPVNPEQRKLAGDYLGAAQMIHMARASLDLEPRFPEAPWVALGVEVLRAIRGLYAADVSGAGGGEDVVALACALNSASWSFAARFEGMGRLLRGLQIPRDTTLIGLLLDFRRNRDPDTLVNYLIKV